MVNLYQFSSKIIKIKIVAIIFFSNHQIIVNHQILKVLKDNVMSLFVNKGPKYTTSSVRNIAGEDHIGIRSVAISIADYLQSEVTSITPRARYWAFFFMGTP